MEPKSLFKETGNSGQQRQSKHTSARSPLATAKAFHSYWGQPSNSGSESHVSLTLAAINLTLDAAAQRSQAGKINAAVPLRALNFQGKYVLSFKTPQIYFAQKPVFMLYRNLLCVTSKSYSPTQQCNILSEHFAMMADFFVF